MPTQPVSDPAFWQERLQTAKKNGHLHYSVYLINPQKWEHIYNAHKDILAKEIEPGMKVLDAGCGYGRMAKLFDPGYYVGVDISPDLLKIAKDQQPGYRFEQYNLTALPFFDHYFDVAFCVSIKQMIVGNLGIGEWVLIQAELMRVANKIIVLEYEDPEIYHLL